jgi:hypothetical protein
MHFNACQPHWDLAEVEEVYKWSYANFFESEIREFNWLTHFNDELTKC